MTAPMIKIAKGNPTVEEIAALIAVLALAITPTEERRANPAATRWRRSGPSSGFAARAPRRWRDRAAGWSPLAPGPAAFAAPQPLGTRSNAS
jgi:hypothetical protein